MDLKRYVLFAPGPTNLDPDVSRVLAGEIIHHRTADFSRLMGAICEKLNRVFLTKEGETLVVTSSGSGGIEAGIASLFQPGDQVIIIRNGYFSENLLHTAEAMHLSIIELAYDWGTPYRLEDVKQAIATNPKVKGILVVHSETSTGALADLKPLGDLAKEHDLLFFVDAVSGLLFNPFHFDEWHVDFAVSASQKGFGLPPGLAFVCLSPKAITKFQKVSTKFYFDLQRYLDFKHRTMQTPATPNILTMLAADVALEKILNKGLDYYQSYAHGLIRRYKERLVPLGYRPLVEDERHQVGGVIAFYCPPGIQSPALQAHLLETEGINIECGVGPIRPKVIRIAAMSFYQEHDIERLLVAIERYTKQHRTAL